MDTDNFIEKAIVSLIYSEPFHAFLLMDMVRIDSTNFNFPAAVTIRSNKIHLLINSDKLKKFTQKEVERVLVHEAQHIYNGHLKRALHIDKKVSDTIDLTDKAINIAMDLAINQYNLGLPEGCITLDWFREAVSKDAKEKECWEYYFDLIKDDVKNNPQKYEGKGEGHDWGDAMSEEINESILKEAVKKATDKLTDNQRGNLPSHIKLAIDSLNYVPRDWRSDIRRFVARQYSAKSKIDWSRRNRRYGVQQAGFKSNSKLTIAVGWDTSGSMDDETRCQIWAELNKLKSQDVEITVIECDCEVGASYKFSKNRAPLCTGGGGTAFAPVFEFIEKNKQKYDGMLYFTDGMGPGNEIIKNPPFPVLWCLVSPYDDNHLPFSNPIYRQTTKVEIKKR